MDVPPQIRAYEHLGGATGARIRYRAPRHGARGLFRGPLPATLLGGVPYLLDDISISGLAAIEAPGHEKPLSLGDEVPVVFMLGDQTLHEDRAGVVRIEEGEFGRKLGVRFTQGFMDVERLAKRYREEFMRLRLKESFNDIRAPVAADLKFACLELLSQIRICRTALEALGDISSPEEMEKLVGDCLALLNPHLGLVGTVANAAIDAGREDPLSLATVKKMFERLITPEMALSGLWTRAYAKPLGYAGDHMLTRQLHHGPRPEAKAFPYFLDRLFCELFAWLPSRTQALADLLAREFSAQRQQEPLKVAVLGSGSVEELRMLASRARVMRSLDLTLIDQDERALGEAQRSLFENRPPSLGLSVRAFHASHTQILNEGELRPHLGPQNIILVPALLDYLRHRPAGQLVEALVTLLAPGGVCLAGCLRRSAESTRWASELVCDWSMIHRSKDEVAALASGLHRARIDIRSDARGGNYLLAIRYVRGGSA